MRSQENRAIITERITGTHVACKRKPIRKATALPATATQCIAVFSPRVSRTHAVMCSLQCSQTLVILGVMNFTVAVTRFVGKVWRGLQVCVQVIYRNLWFVWLQTLVRGVEERSMSVTCVSEHWIYVYLDFFEEGEWVLCCKSDVVLLSH